MLELFDISPKERLIAQLLLSNRIMTSEQVVQAMRHSCGSLMFSFTEVVLGEGLITLDALEALLVDYFTKLRQGEEAIAGPPSEERMALLLQLQVAFGNKVVNLFEEIHGATPEQLQLMVNLREEVEALA